MVTRRDLADGLFEAGCFPERVAIRIDRELQGSVCTPKISELECTHTGSIPGQGEGRVAGYGRLEVPVRSRDVPLAQRPFPGRQQRSESGGIRLRGCDGAIWIPILGVHSC